MASGDPITAAQLAAYGIVAAPILISAAGTTTSGTTEIRDSGVSTYAWTAQPGVRYRVMVSGRTVAGSVAADRYVLRVRYTTTGTTPTAASTLVGHDSTIVSAVIAGGGAVTQNHNASFIPVAGGGTASTVTIALFVARVTGTGAGTPTGSGEMYAESIGFV